MNRKKQIVKSCALSTDKKAKPLVAFKYFL